MSIEIVEGFIAGAIGRIVEMHGICYDREWNLVGTFEALATARLGGFAVRYDPQSVLVLLAKRGNEIAGFLIPDLNDPESGNRDAHLRFFIMDDTTRGTGLGNRLLDQAIEYVDACCGGKCWLPTFGGLDAARHMYEKRGFALTEEKSGTRRVFERSGSQD